MADGSDANVEYSVHPATEQLGYHNLNIDRAKMKPTKGSVRACV